tara:strand:+ start:298 stop:438 length:141 start_codon:yes stop_codon:yes gene_type:complete
MFNGIKSHYISCNQFCGIRSFRFFAGKAVTDGWYLNLNKAPWTSAG